MRPRESSRAPTTDWGRLFTLAGACSLLLGYGALRATGWDSDHKRCLAAYAEAHTALDSAAVDARWLGGRGPRTPDGTCGRMRRDGTLDRYRLTHPAPR
jgi:hypothetical protein